MHQRPEPGAGVSLALAAFPKGRRAGEGAFVLHRNHGLDTLFGDPPRPAFLPPPPDAAESGFACVSLESLLGAGGSPAFGPRHLRQALRAAEESSGGQRAAARQAGRVKFV